jgi:cob(I)alamin adenosyltransferase
MSTDSTINGQKIEKDNLIFEVLGCLDRASVEIGSAKLIVESEISQILTKIQNDLADFSSIIAGCKKQGASPRMVAGTDSSEVEQGKLNWLEKQIKNFESKIDIPKKFVLSGDSELEVRLSLARVGVRKAERRVISLSRYQKLPQELLDYLNRLSWFLFLLAINH